MNSASYRGPESPRKLNLRGSVLRIITPIVVISGVGYVLFKDARISQTEIPVPPIGATIEPNIDPNKIGVNPFVVVHTPEGENMYVGDQVIFERGSIPGFDDIITADQLLNAQSTLNDLLLPEGVLSTSTLVDNDLITFEIHAVDTLQSDIPFPAEILETVMESTDQNDLLGKLISTGRISLTQKKVSKFTERNLLTNFEPDHADIVMGVLQQRYPGAGLESQNLWIQTQEIVQDENGNEFTFVVEKPTSATVIPVRDTIIRTTGSNSINYKSVPRTMPDDQILLALDSAHNNLLHQLLVQLGQSGYAPFTDKIAIRTSLGGLAFSQSTYDYDMVIHLRDGITPEDLTLLINAQDHFSFSRPEEFGIHKFHVITVYPSNLASSGPQQIFRPNVLRMFALMEKPQ